MAKRIGLALSGGGYRATIYHLGTIRKLRDMNILEKIDVISTISGGSITGAYLGLNLDNFEEFENGLRKLVKQNIITGVLTSLRFITICLLLLTNLSIIIYLLFTKYAWMSSPLLLVTIYILLKYQFKIFPVSNIINELYSKWFFNHKKLSDLPKSPIIAINATNIETGRQFTFSKNKMSDSSYEFPINGEKSITFIPDEFPISLAVASSTCVPFAFTPIHIEKKYFKDPEDSKKVKPCLVDGGVYDNQGVHKLTQKNSTYECDIVIVSDAGNMISKINTFTNVIQLLIRTSDIFMNRIKNYQMIQHVYESNKHNKKQVAYQSLGWDLESCIGGFMSNLKKGAILDIVIKTHNISQMEIDNKEWDNIQHKIEERIEYRNILKNKPTDNEIKIARSVKTNLKTLSDAEINFLIKQAECMTELQVKLYCPELVY